jgi:hypothetical protein
MQVLLGVKRKSESIRRAGDIVTSEQLYLDFFCHWAEVAMWSAQFAPFGRIRDNRGFVVSGNANVRDIIDGL